MLKSAKQNDFVIALGGSIVNPGEINTGYLKAFYNFIRRQTGRGKKFIIVVGGGALTRQFQQAASFAAAVTNEDKDWIGIHATRLHAHLLRTIFQKIAHPVVIDERRKLKDFDGHSLIIGAGWRPGWSTDFVAAQIAVDFKIPQLIVLGKPEYVYDKDNQKFSDAKPFEEISWKDYLKLIPSKWSPGMHAPVDPIAAKLAQKANLKVVVAGGKDLANVQNILAGKKFHGTTIF